jgi:hypothetical protein
MASLNKVESSLQPEILAIGFGGRK